MLRLAPLLWLVLAPLPAAAQASRQEAVEAGLRGGVAFEGQAETWTIAERMERWKVPGVSVAVIDGGRIAWERGYGVVADGGTVPVTPGTRFQAASISKPVAATAALQLVRRGILSLDGDVNAALKRWKLAATPFTADKPVTLRHLLSHTGGTTVSGFPGYEHGTPTPTLVQLLAGEPPAITSAIVSDATPGERWRYSGGGTQIVQLMMEDATGRDFADIVGAQILAPLGMRDSGYGVPPRGAHALGHGFDGRTVPGGWNDYPEAAAAGLWSTPGDLARFALALAASWRGEPDAPLDRATARAMMTPVMNSYGLSVGLIGTGEDFAFVHSGSNEGFRAIWVMHPKSGQGAVIMTNGEGGAMLTNEILHAVAVTYGWANFHPRTQRIVAIAPQVLAARTGKWATRANGETIEFDISRDGAGLRIVTPRGTTVFMPTGEAEMVSGETGASVRFETGADGTPLLKAYGMELRRQP